MTRNRKILLVLSALVLALVGPIAVSLYWLAQVPAREPFFAASLPRIGSSVTIPVTTATAVRARVTFDVNPSGFAARPLEHAVWAGLELPLDTATVLARRETRWPETHDVILRARKDGGVVVKVDGKAVARREPAAPLDGLVAPLDAALRRDHDVILRGDGAVPWDTVALVIAIASRKGRFVQSNLPRDTRDHGTGQGALHAAVKAGCEAIRIRADARTPWVVVAPLVFGAEMAGIRHYTIVVERDGDELDLVSFATPGPHRTFLCGETAIMEWVLDKDPR